MLLLLLLQKMVTLVVLAVVLTLVILVVVFVVEPISVCVVLLEAFVAPLHQLIDHVESRIRWFSWEVGMEPSSSFFQSML